MEKSIDLAQLQRDCKELFLQKKKVEELKKKKTAEEKIFAEMEKNIIDQLEHHNLKNFDTGFGKISKVNRPYAKITNKEALAEYLKKIGVYESLVTFNAAKMNSFYNEEREKAIEEKNFDFHIDGMEVTSNRVKLSIRNINLDGINE